jgi:hypothetical protein
MLSNLFLSSPTCYRMMRRGRRVTPSSRIPRVGSQPSPETLYYTLHIYIKVVYSVLSQVIRDILKQRLRARS